MIFYLMFVIIPLALTVAGAVKGSFVIMALSIPVLFLLVALLPFCKKRENLWMFIYGIITLIPVNIFIINHAELYVYLGENIFSEIITYASVFLLMQSVEQVALGLITRFIWKRQYKLPVRKES